MVLKIIQLLIVAIFRQKQQLSYYQLFYLYYFFFSIVWITHKIFITDINSFFFFFFIYLFFILPWRTTFPKIHNFIYIFIYLLIYKIRSIMFNFGHHVVYFEVEDKAMSIDNFVVVLTSKEASNLFGKQRCTITWICFQLLISIWCILQEFMSSTFWILIFRLLNSKHNRLFTKIG